MLETSGDLRLHAFCRLAFATGMRRGEIIAIRLNDIDFETGKLRMDDALTPIWQIDGWQKCTYRIELG
jgi:integrase